MEFEIRRVDYITLAKRMLEEAASVDQSDARLTSDQEFVDSIPAGSGNILSEILIIKYFVWSFSYFC